LIFETKFIKCTAINALENKLKTKYFVIYWFDFTMKNETHLARFVQAQTDTFDKALSEIKAGKKVSHWMWYIFPQISGLGQSETAKYYAISDIAEAEEFLNHKVLGPNLIRISKALLDVNGKTANEIFGSPDNLKLRSSMTLFAAVENSDAVFTNVLTKYFDAKPDQKTLAILDRK